jgi:hypothetical protein
VLAKRIYKLLKTWLVHEYRWWQERSSSMPVQKISMLAMQVLLYQMFPEERPNRSRGSSAFNCIPVSSIWQQSKSSAEAHRAPSVTVAVTSLRTCFLEQLTIQLRQPAGRHVKISRIRYCSGSHRSADSILFLSIAPGRRANICVSYDACEQCGGDDHHPTVLEIMGLGKSIALAKNW